MASIGGNEILPRHTTSLPGMGTLHDNNDTVIQRNAQGGRQPRHQQQLLGMLVWSKIVPMTNVDEWCSQSGKVRKFR